MKLKSPAYKYSSVLLIDDNELDNFINQKTIEANNFAKNIYVSSGARSAIEFLTNLIILGSGNPGSYPGIIFIDINMPMMDGFQFAEHFKNKLAASMPDTKLVILTSSVFYEDVQKAQDISADIFFLNKPLTRTMLEKI